MVVARDFNSRSGFDVSLRMDSFVVMLASWAFCRLVTWCILFFE